jgi:hypothetical protein
MLHEAAATVTSTSDFTATANIPIKGRFFLDIFILYIRQKAVCIQSLSDHHGLAMLLLLPVS